MKRLIVGVLCLAATGLLHAKTCLVRSPKIDQEKTIYIDQALKDAWKESFITDTNFKVGICCTPLYGKSLQDRLTVESFLPLSLLQHVSLYSFDSLDGVTIPESMKIFQVEQTTKRSLTHMAAIIDLMDLVITTDPTVAYLAANLHKKTWLITSATDNLEQLSSEHPDLTLFAHANNSELLFNIMHKLAYTIEQPATEVVMAEVQIGELIDKMTILEIKTERITDERKLENIWKELNSLRTTFDEFFVTTPELEQLIKQLKSANEALWETEDLIRDKEREKCFDDEFVALARSVYIQNDERCRFKRMINELLGSRLVEEKSYKPYN